MTDHEPYTIRWRWLRFMYIYTTVVAGAYGLGVIFAPGTVRSIFDMPPQDPVVFGLNGSMFLAFALVSVLGFRAPLKFCPILLAELAYKTIWFCGVAAPLAVRGRFPSSSIAQVVIFATFIGGDFVAIPFRYVFGGDVRSVPGASM
jgi:hypothetical protein